MAIGDPTRRYAIIGTGALGGYYGARLAHAGIEVHFLAHRDAAHIREHGLKVESPDGDFSIDRPNVHEDPAMLPAVDVAVIALKSTQNHLLPSLLSPALGEQTVVLVLQNGLEVERAAAAVAGDDRILGGLCFLCSNKVGPGHIRHLDYGRIALGEYDPQRCARGVTERMRTIAADFERAGIAIELSQDLYLARWKKLAWNIPFNGLSVLLDATTDRLMAEPATEQLARLLMEEVAAGAAACGRTFNAGFIDKLLHDTAKMKAYRTSMKIDYDEGRPMEIESIFAQPLRAAAEAGIELPRIDTLLRQLRFLDHPGGGA